MRHQAGASYFAILFAIIGFAFIAKIAIALWGPYWDDRVVDTQIKEVLASSSKTESPSKFSENIGRRLEINNLHDLKFNDIAQVSNSGGLKVHKSYEVRKNFMMNIDLVLKFEKDFDQSAVKTQ